MRIRSIDSLRGIAILGILFMNIPFHLHIYLAYVPFDPPLLSDKVINFIYSVFADGRFRTLFCILFGAGLAVQHQYCLKKGIDSQIFLKKRLNWLLLFGVIHGLFIFGGDILTLYSLTAMVFIKSIDAAPEMLLKRAKKHLIIGSSIFLVIGLAGLAGAVFAPELDGVMRRGSEEYIAKLGQWNRNLVVQTVSQGSFFLFFLLIAPFTIFWQTLGLMYLGAYLYKTQFFSQGFSNARFKKVLLAAVVTTLLAVTPQLVVDTLTMDIVILFSAISAIFVSLVYAHITVRLHQKSMGFLKYLEAPGRLAFSLYIFQSIAMGLLLRWIIPVQAFEFSMIDLFLIACVFTVLQIIVANIYFRFYRQGPLESLWRKCYLKSVAKHVSLKEGQNT